MSFFTLCLSRALLIYISLSSTFSVLQALVNETHATTYSVEHTSNTYTSEFCFHLFGWARKWKLPSQSFMSHSFLHPSLILRLISHRPFLSVTTLLAFLTENCHQCKFLSLPLLAFQDTHWRHLSLQPYLRFMMNNSRRKKKGTELLLNYWEREEGLRIRDTHLSRTSS